MIFAVLDDNEAEDSQWDYYILPVAADLLVFGYFWFITYQYASHKRDEYSAIVD